MNDNNLDRLKNGNIGIGKFLEDIQEDVLTDEDFMSIEEYIENFDEEY